MKDKFTDIVDTAFTAHMEEQLDEVEAGKVDWKSLLSQFYGGFEQELKKAEQDLDGERIKVPDEVSEEVCPQCGRNLVIKSGRFGRFLPARLAGVRLHHAPGGGDARQVPQVRGPALQAHGQEQEDGQAVYLLLLRAGQQQGREHQVRLYDLGRACEGKLPRVRLDHVQKAG